MSVHLVNPSHLSFGVGVITPRWLYVLAAATPAPHGRPCLTDETLEPFDLDTVQPRDVVGIGIHTGNALRGYEIGRAVRARGALVVFGGIRADRFHFHLERDADFVKYVITKRRLLAGPGSAGDRQRQFVIAEEGITAAAYVVISIVDRTWTIEECGDRDPSGARVGALLQALVAGEPAERRPVIRGWLPPGFVPPQVTIVSARPATEIMMMRLLRSVGARLPLSNDDVLNWRSDLF